MQKALSKKSQNKPAQKKVAQKKVVQRHSGKKREDVIILKNVWKIFGLALSVLRARRQVPSARYIKLNKLVIVMSGGDTRTWTGKAYSADRF